jgi:hypothetical protein
MSKNMKVLLCLSTERVIPQGKHSSISPSPVNCTSPRLFLLASHQRLRRAHYSVKASPSIVTTKNWQTSGSVSTQVTGYSSLIHLSLSKSSYFPKLTTTLHYKPDHTMPSQPLPTKAAFVAHRLDTISKCSICHAPFDAQPAS